MSWDRYFLALGLGSLSAFTLLVSPLCAQREGDVPYTQASFEVSVEPAKVVLQLVTSGGLSGYSRTMTVYGDGQVELQRSRKGTIVEKHTTALGPDGVRHLLTPAIEQGIAEWDSETIRAWMRQRYPRIPDIADGERVQVVLHLESYQRGDHAQSPLSVSFRTKTPRDYAKIFPDIAQFHGVNHLMDFYAATWEQASKEEQ